MKTTRRRVLAASFVCVLACVAAVFAFRSRRHTVITQIDVADAVALVDKAHTVDGQTQATLSALTLAANTDLVLRSVIGSEEFRALPLASQFPDDDVHHKQAVAALAAMTTWSVRTDPPAIRVTVAASEHAAAETLATLIAKALRDRAIDAANGSFANRSELERQILQMLESRSTDQHNTLDKLRVLAAEFPSAPPETATKALDAAAQSLGSCEVLSRELANLDRLIQSQRAAAREFDHFSAECNTSASFWVVPAQAIADPGWSPVPHINPTDAAFVFKTPAAGKDWLAAALTTRDRALSLAIDLPEVRSTEWMKLRESPGDRAHFLDAAKRELAQHVTLKPFGDGSILVMGLDGKFSDDDRRTLMTALSRGVLSELSEQNSIDLVGRREQLERRLAALGVELREVEVDFRRAAAVLPMANMSPAIHDSADIDRRLQSLIATHQTLEIRKTRLELETSTFWQTAWMVKSVE